MKLKKIPDEYIITILDRMTRFEPAQVRYKRVFDDIINKFLIDEKLKNLSLDDEIKIVEEIFELSFGPCLDNRVNNILLDIEDKYFIKNSLSDKYLSAKLNLTGAIDSLKESSNLPKNVNWLRYVASNNDNIEVLREKYSLLYPLKKLILCEGQTEFELLDTIFKLFSLDIDKLGINLIPAGGKNQVARKYYDMIEYTKLPFFILLDSDAKSIYEMLLPKLRPKDKIYLIKSGEFEDLIPKEILQKTINFVHKNEYNCIFDDFSPEVSMVENLKNIYKKYGFGEFKKAKFARELKEYTEKFTKCDDFKNSEIVEIIESLK